MTIAMRHVVKFPANVQATKGVDVTRANGTYTFKLNYENLTPAATVASNVNVAFQDPATGAMGVTTLASALNSNANIQAIANTDTAIDKLGYWNGTSVYALTDFPAYARSLVGSSNAANARVALGTVIGSDVQAWSLNLDEFSGKTVPTGNVVGSSDTQTLTNKTIDGDDNTFSNVPSSAVTGLSTVATSGAYGDLSGLPTLGDLAAKDQAAIADIAATGAPSSTTALFGDGTWKTPAGIGDMIAATYDPDNVGANAFDSSNTAYLPVWADAVPSNVRDALALLGPTPQNFGAKGDGVQITGAVSITSGAAALAVTGASFTAGDVGKRIVVPGAGAAGAELITTISAFTDATHVTLADNAATTLSAVSKLVTYGTDDLAALNKFFAHISGTSGKGYIPDGKYIVSAALDTITASNWSVCGAGRRCSKIVYTGTSRTNDIMFVSGASYVNLTDFHISSAVVMTSGFALHMYVSNLYKIDGVVLDDYFSDALTLHGGLWIDDSNYGIYQNASVFAINEAIRASGTGTGAVGLFLDNMKIIGEAGGAKNVAAVHVGGGFGGIYFGYLEIFGHNFGIIVDTSTSSVGNNQIFISNLLAIDNCGDAGVYIDDAIASNKSFVFEGWSASQHSTSGNGFVVANWNSGTINLTGAQIISNKGNGINIIDTTAKVYIDATSNISANLGVGISAASGVQLFCDAFPFGNGTDFGSNCRAGTGAFNAPWSSFAATVAAGSGALTTASATVKYAIRGKRVDLQVDITVTANGTGAGQLNVSLPSGLSSLDGLLSGRATTVSGAGCTGTVAGGSIVVVKYDNTYPGADGVVIKLGGTLELL